VTAVLLAAVAFVGMEGVTYLAHRFLMHGPGIGWHRSHHQRRQGRFERNDLYPLTFALVTVAAMAAGTAFGGLDALVPVGAGVTAYGAAYVFVHDLYVHRRLPALRARWALLDRLADAHRVHHLFGGEPYGMLLPWVPADLRERAARTSRSPFERGAAVPN
jgi:beta-carotene 3-hydroxylase